MKKIQLIQDLYFYLIIPMVIIFVVFTYRVLLGPLVIAALLTYLLYPVVSWITRRTPLKRGHVVGLVYILFVGLVILGFIYLSPIVVQQARVLSGGMQEIPAYFVDVEADMKTLGFEVPLSSIWFDLRNDAIQLLKPERIFRVIQSASANVIWIAVIFATSFYLLRDWEQLREWLIGLAPDDYQLDIRRLHQEIKAVWRAYLRGQLTIMFLLGLLSGLGAVAIGLPGALILGILAGTLALIPTLGPAVATALAAIIAWTQGSTYLDISNFVMTILAVGIFQIVQAIEGIWLTPQIMGRRLHLHPGLVLVAVIGSLVTVGAIMALIVVPLIGSLDIVIRYTRRMRAGLDAWSVEETSPIYDSSEGGLVDE
jgi:predicted PurR-regulated permease PerM